MFSHFSRIAPVVAALSIISVSSAFADDATARATFQKAKEAFAQRNATNLSSTDNAVKLADLALSQAQDDDLKYDILIIKARALYWNGFHTADKDQKMAIHEAGQNTANAAREISDVYAEAPYLAGIHLARWAEAKGIMASLGKKGELIKYMEDANERVTRDEKPGVEVDGYGPSRVLGRLYYKLPGFAGGSNEKSEKYLKAAFENAKNFAINVNYYAETLVDGNKKDLAKQILDELLNNANHEARLNNERAPETADELVDTAEIRKKIR